MNAATPFPATKTTCPYCGVGCGVIARPDAEGNVHIEGDPEHPSNFGRLCSKGAALGETLSPETRLLHPMVDGARASWDEALDRAALGLCYVIETYGPQAVAFYLSGQLLTEDYYVANKLMKGFIGSANVDTNSRLCMASSVAGHKRAFGSDTVPGCYDDLEQADLVVFTGSNAAWCHPVLYQRMMRAREMRGTKFVNIDPRRTATSDDCDLHLSVAPGQDSVLFAGLLVHLVENGFLNAPFVAAHTANFEAVLSASREMSPDIATVARKCALAEADIAAFYALWASCPRVVTLYSQGVNQSAQGTDKVNAIINCHLATGRIGKPGQGPFSLTGQPNAMGGREVGGLANQLAAHMGFSGLEVNRVRRFWNAPRMATREGLKAVEMFDAIDRGEVKALWVMGTNPAVSMPRADFVRAALGKLDLFVVSENVSSNDTMNAGAHVLFPAAAWGEKDGTVTNSERRISRQRAFLSPAGETRPDWRIICDVAARLGFGEAFCYRGSADIFREHAALSAFENQGARDFDIGELARLSGAQYDALAPTQWPAPAGGESRARMFGDGRFFTDDGRARFVAAAEPALRHQRSPDYPLLLNTGRVRDQWHTMTRTGLSQRLAGHRSEPFLDIHADDAKRFGVGDGGLARVQTAFGSAILRVRIADAQTPGEVFAPIHWSEETSASGRVGALVNAKFDPVSGQPELKATPCAVGAVSYARVGFVMSRRRIAFGADGFWNWSAIDGGFATGLETDASTELLLARLGFGDDVETISYRDESRGVDRTAILVDGRLEAVLFLGSAAGDAPWRGLMAAWTANRVGDEYRSMLLSGRLDEEASSCGPTVCACFGVGRDAIVAAGHEGAADVRAVGAATKAGTNCGSCIPEIRKILASAPARIAEPV